MSKNEKFLVKLMDDLLVFKNEYEANDKEKYCIDVVRNAIFFAYVKQPYNALTKDEVVDDEEE